MGIWSEIIIIRIISCGWFQTGLAQSLHLIGLFVRVGQAGHLGQAGRVGTVLDSADFCGGVARMGE